ncbi:YkvA family protein [Sphingobacterium corticibacterium]|uniref:DUF1232 domain-containing protein n=1 Tax=Sphingobacterium corticibacterium TaxID=2484746 RepID=A0A4Q6XZZ3_9SPHI|nr:YkvA family protein [Sphingobacterium corticibacterium]RZF62236.1 DUF1232 domain-containing protein [Sphingobacterium corticibacterium]
MVLKKLKYLGKAFALFKVFKTYSLTNKDIADADNLAEHLSDRKAEFKLILAMAGDSIKGRYKIGKLNLGIIVATVVYVISPLDAIPDVIPVVGWVDDVAIISYALSKLKSEVIKYQKWVASMETGIDPSINRVR